MRRLGLGAWGAVSALVLSSAQASDNPAAALTDLGQALLPTSAANAVASPLVVATALGMVQAGANGAAESEIESLFGPRPAGAQALRQGLPDLMKQMQGKTGTPSPLTLASRMWLDTGAAAAVPAAYSKRLAQRWNADATRVSFAQGEAARAQINSWTAEHTAGRVKDLLPAGSVGTATQMVLTAAVHFRSPWERPFNAAQTEARAFKTAAGESKTVPTMLDERAVMQARVAGQWVMEIPFAAGAGGANGGFALLLVVPDEGQPARFTGVQLAQWRAALQPVKCAFAMPRFAIAPQAAALKPALMALGVKAVFSDAADLRPMLGRAAHKAHLGDVHHAAGITVDEAGGEAVAAAAATVLSKSLALPLPACAVDRAFAFALVHQASGAPLFVGRVGDPTAMP